MKISSPKRTCLSFLSKHLACFPSQIDFVEVMAVADDNACVVGCCCVVCVCIVVIGDINDAWELMVVSDMTVLLACDAAVVAGEVKRAALAITRGNVSKIVGGI